MVAYSAGRLREHFLFRPFVSKVVVFLEGKEPLHRCDLCRVHLPAGRLIRNNKTYRCNSNTKMRWRQRDVAIAAKCSEATFIMTGEGEVERI